MEDREYDLQLFKQSAGQHFDISKIVWLDISGELEDQKTRIAIVFSKTCNNWISFQ